MVLSFPSGISAQALLNHPCTDGHDRTILFRDRDKHRRTDHLAVVILPADQCLHAPQLFARRMKLGLIIHNKILLKNSIFKLILNFNIF